MGFAVGDRAARSDPPGPGPAERGRRAASILARVGLIARTVFYLLLVELVVQLVVHGRGGRQTNANGALSSVGGSLPGRIALFATAAGFVAFGIARIWGAVRDQEPGGWRRATTALQGAFYLPLAGIPLSYALGQHSAGSEQQQHRTATGLLNLPAGRELLIAAGLILLVVCANQIRTGLSQDYVDGLELDDAPGWVCRLVRAAGTVGIPARAAVFVPVGVFFIVAGFRADAGAADGLDGELSRLAQHAWGDVVLAAVALGLLVFAVYSALEARYRTLVQGK